MHTRSQQTNPGCWLRAFLAAFVAVLTILGLAATSASASAAAGAETRVRASAHPAGVLVGPPQRETAGQQPDPGLDPRQIVVATGVATKTAANVCGLKSFSSDTLVLMADGSKKPIEDIEVGDKVIATDPETGEQSARRVVHVWVHEDTLTDLKLDDGTALTTTEDHPFWSVDDQRFEPTDQLANGERVLGADGILVAVDGLDPDTARVGFAYNLTVEGLHTYRVGDDAILVHNAGCISSVIGNDPFLVRAAQNAGKNSQVQREMVGLFAQLSSGNMNPGIGTKTLSGTDISYARSRGGARLFFRTTDSGIQIVGKASKANESSVINHLMGLYGP